MSLPFSDVDDPAAVLAAEISDRANRNDPRIALDPRLLADVATLRRLVAERTTDPVSEQSWAVLLDYIEALVHWARSRFLPRPDAEGDLRAAVELFRPIHRHNPGYVPWAIRSLYEDVADIVDGQIVERADTFTDEGLALLNEATGGDAAVLDRCVEALRGAVEATPDGHPHRGQRLTNLCAGLMMRHELNGDRQAVDDAVAAAREAVAVTGAESPYLADCLYGLGMALGTLAVATDDRGTEDEAFQVLTRTADEMAATGHPKLIDCLRILGLRLGLRATSERDAAALEQAVDMLGRAVAAADESDPRYLDLLERQGLMLQLLHERTGDRRHATEGLAVFRRAVGRTPVGHPQRSRYLRLLSSACRASYETSRGQAVIDEAVELCRMALADAGTPAELAETLAELGSALTVRHGESRDPSDLSEAVAALREAVSVDATNPVWLSTLGSALLDTHLTTGDPAALDEAIRHARAAVAASSTDDPLRTLRQNLVGRMLWHRGERTGDREALAEAITVLDGAAGEAPEDHPLQFSLRTNLGAALGHLHRLTRSVPVLDHAITAHRWVVDRIPDDHVKRGLYLGNLGATYNQKYHATREPADLDAAITTLGQAVEAAAARELPGLLTNLTNALLDRYALTGDGADLRLAAGSARRAVDLLPVDHPWRCAALTMLGQVYQHDPEELDQALHVLTQAAAMPTAPVDTRVEAARLCGDLAVGAGRPDTALTAFTTAVELLPLLGGRQLRHADQEQQLARYHGAAGDAAACAIAIGRPDRALELLEAGRAILHARVLEDRNDLSELESRAPELAHRFAALREELAGPASPTGLDAGLQDAAGIDRRHELAREWAELVETIRTGHNGAGLFGPPAIDELLPAAEEGPVVTVNVSRYRCDALLLTTTGVHAVPLPRLAFADLVERGAAFLRTLDTAARGRTAQEREEAERAIGETIAWLRDTITRPVLDAIGPHGATRRIWWTPTSVLTFLPLHAAVIDDSVPSYTPTVGALLRARDRNRPGARSGGLVVALPNTPGYSALPGVARERDLLAGLFPGLDVLADARATRSAVLRELPAHGWVHLACHGHNDVDQPSHSHLRLWDGPLDVRDVFGVDTERGSLAFLNACETAQGGALLADEALHLGGAFHLAGYVHVIATLWPAHDGASLALTNAFYRRVTDGAGPDPAGSAAALHAAVRQLRDRHPTRPSRWAPYVHFGP